MEGGSEEGCSLRTPSPAVQAGQSTIGRQQVENQEALLFGATGHLLAEPLLLGGVGGHSLSAQTLVWWDKVHPQSGRSFALPKISSHFKNTFTKTGGKVPCLPRPNPIMSQPP